MARCCRERLSGQSEADVGLWDGRPGADDADAEEGSVIGGIFASWTRHAMLVLRNCATTKEMGRTYAPWGSVTADKSCPYLLTFSM